MNEIIGNNIKTCRKINGMTQKYLAEKIGISTQGLGKIEMGKVSPRATTIKKIIDVLCITPNQLFGIEQITEANSNIVKKLKALEM